MTDQTRALPNTLLWLLGVCGLALLAYYAGWSELYEALERLGPLSILGWVTVTIFLRLILTETLTRPITVLGGKIRRIETFWLGWLRSFFNQFIPFGGTAYLAHFLRNRTMLSWAQMAALASPQVLFLGVSLGFLGCIFTLANDTIGSGLYWTLTAAFALLACACVLLVAYSARLSGLLPDALSKYIRPTADALDRFHSHSGLMAWMVVVHSTAIFLRGLRIWLLFAALGQPADFATVMLLSCVGEIALILQITPGGIGFREGTLVGAAFMLGMDTKLVTVVAVLDRLLMIGIISAFAPISLYFIHSDSASSNQAKLRR